MGEALRLRPSIQSRTNVHRRRIKEALDKEVKVLDQRLTKMMLEDEGPLVIMCPSCRLAPAFVERQVPCPHISCAQRNRLWHLGMTKDHVVLNKTAQKALGPIADRNRLVQRGTRTQLMGSHPVLQSEENQENSLDDSFELSKQPEPERDEPDSLQLYGLTEADLDEIGELFFDKEDIDIDVMKFLQED
jgi:hypothetical protein